MRSYTDCPFFSNLNITTGIYVSQYWPNAASMLDRRRWRWSRNTLTLIGSTSSVVFDAYLPESSLDLPCKNAVGIGLFVKWYWKNNRVDINIYLHIRKCIRTNEKAPVFLYFCIESLRMAIGSIPGFFVSSWPANHDVREARCMLFDLCHVHQPTLIRPFAICANGLFVKAQWQNR